MIFGVSCSTCVTHLFLWLSLAHQMGLWLKVHLEQRQKMTVHMQCVFGKPKTHSGLTGVETGFQVRSVHLVLVGILIVNYVVK